ncbi:uncharacterized protein [Spinacia oleracea]|uniref:3'-5' exonuclease domain-containing protein n=1 Tax=Spinacia oleracea TaxID=3562 RepID=A0ABM3QLN4_SPIOL|nr:uncharacterized protein LOC110776661 [Spinacia oleracea]
MSDSTHKVPIGKTIVIITQVITTSDQLNQSLEDLLWYTQHDDLKRLVGLDVEKHYSSSISSTSSIEKVSAVMLCCGNYCLIIQLLHMDSNASCYLSKFLQLEGLTFVGVQIQHCLKALDRDYGIKCRNALDLDLATSGRSERGEAKREAVIACIYLAVRPLFLYDILRACILAV